MTDTLYGVFGGTFDPVHNGHVETVRQVQKQCALQHVRFIPAASPPHRKPGANSMQRLEMVTMATADIPEFRVDDREHLRGAPSYTYDTLVSLKHELPHQTPCFIVGIDAMLDIESWHRWQELFSLAHFIIMQRPGWTPPAILPDWWQRAKAQSLDELKNSDAGKILQVETTANPISATRIRHGVANDIDISNMLNNKVWQYIQKNNLYSLQQN